MTNQGILALVAAWYDGTHIAQMDYEPARDATTDLLQKVIAMKTIPTDYRNGSLDDLIGEEMPVGAYIEEYQEDLILPQDYVADGSGAFKFYPSSFRKARYNIVYTEKQLIKSVKRDQFREYMKDRGAFQRFILDTTKTFSDSYAVWKEDALLNLLKLTAQAVIAATSSTTTFAANTAYAKGTYLRSASSGTIAHGVVFNDIPASSGVNWTTRVEQGDIVVLDGLVTTLAKPTDSTSGEAFAIALKNLSKLARWKNHHNLNGALKGKPEGLNCFIEYDNMTNFEVTTLAGAFHEDRLALPTRIREIPCANGEGYTGLGDGIYALLADSRAIKMHNQINEVTSDFNAQGRFVNYYFTWKPVPFVSANSFLHVFKTAD